MIIKFFINIFRLKEVGTKPEELSKVRLLLIGSCRGEEDQKRVNDLKTLAKSLAVDEYCDFMVNFKFELMLNNLAQSAVGIHSMLDEHFGIGVRAQISVFYMPG